VPGLIRLYADYLHEEYGGIDSDYVFVRSRSTSALVGAMCGSGTSSPGEGSRYWTRLWCESSVSSLMRIPFLGVQIEQLACFSVLPGRGQPLPRWLRYRCGVTACAVGVLVGAFAYLALRTACAWNRETVLALGHAVQAARRGPYLAGPRS
jgi:hypothetical protein